MRAASRAAAANSAGTDESEEKQREEIEDLSVKHTRYQPLRMETKTSVSSVLHTQYMHTVHQAYSFLEGPDLKKQCSAKVPDIYISCLICNSNVKTIHLFNLSRLLF